MLFIARLPVPPPRIQQILKKAHMKIILIEAHFNFLISDEMITPYFIARESVLLFTPLHSFSKTLAIKYQN